MIICKRPAPPDDHLQEACPPWMIIFKSLAPPDDQQQQQQMQMIIRRDQSLANDHSEGPASCKWSSPRSKAVSFKEFIKEIEC